MKELVLLFLKLGITGFGGPPAHLEMMRREVVENRRWISEQELLDMIGAANLIPGPNSTEVAMHIGHRMAGWKGLVFAGAAFILPAAIVTGLLALLYTTYGGLPLVHEFAAGLKAGILGVMVVSGIHLSRPAFKSSGLIFVALGSAVLSLMSVPEAFILLIAGTTGVMLILRSRTVGVNPLPIFLFFLQIGATIYGGGFVLVSYLQTGLVDQLGWITEDRLLEAIAVGQVTPGPVFSTATFVGYVLGGPLGAVAATCGIFLPSFVFVAFLGRITSWMRKHENASAFLAGVTAASVSLIFATAIKLSPAALSTLPDWILAGLVFLAGMGTKYNPGLLIVAAGLVRLAIP